MFFNVNLKSKIGKEWEYLTNKTASDFLNIKGWPYNEKSFVKTDVGTKQSRVKLKTQKAVQIY